MLVKGITVRLYIKSSRFFRAQSGRRFIFNLTDSLTEKLAATHSDGSVTEPFSIRLMSDIWPYESISVPVNDIDGNEIALFTVTRDENGDPYAVLNCDQMAKSQFDLIWNAIWSKYGIDLYFKLDELEVEYSEKDDIVCSTAGTIKTIYIDYPLVRYARQIEEEEQRRKYPGKHSFDMLAAKH